MALTKATARGDPQWYIDAWAPTDGMVFASRRMRSEDPWDAAAVALDPKAAVATFAIAAPGFEPQPVDRSVAFGAARRGFQERFSTNGETEFAFESLDQLIRFARRVYAGGGPGTTGGVVGEPPEPGPMPEGGGARRGIVQEFLGIDIETTNAKGEDLLRALQEASTSQVRAGVIERAISMSMASVASMMLASFAFESEPADGNSETHFHLVLAAIRLARAFNVLEPPFSFVHHRDPRGLAVWRRAIDQHHYRWPWPVELSRPQLAASSDATVPQRWVQAMGMPASVRTMLDVVSYVAADRDYVARSDQGSLLLLLLAAAANFRAPFVSFDEFPPAANHPFHLAARAEYCRFIADWLPVEQLPPVLEQEVHQWCWRGPRGQRGNPFPKQSGGR